MTSLSPVYLLIFIGFAEQSIMACWTLGFWNAEASSGSSMIFFKTSSGLIPTLSNCFFMSSSFMFIAFIMSGFIPGIPPGIPCFSISSICPLISGLLRIHLKVSGFLMPSGRYGYIISCILGSCIICSTMSIMPPLPPCAPAPAEPAEAAFMTSGSKAGGGVSTSSTGFGSKVLSEEAPSSRSWNTEEEEEEEVVAAAGAASSVEEVALAGSSAFSALAGSSDFGGSALGVETVVDVVLVAGAVDVGVVAAAWAKLGKPPGAPAPAAPPKGLGGAAPPPIGPPKPPGMPPGMPPGIPPPPPIFFIICCISILCKPPPVKKP
mmetsp:Transcript_5263/g.18955  ORF Transcript_5263/g.18955 Transcript_5263/m.18955 type:complete len:321 (+) Transcript_5263:1836-2798(+)